MVRVRWVEQVDGESNPACIPQDWNVSFHPGSRIFPFPSKRFPIPIQEKFPCRSIKLPCSLLKESNSEQSEIAVNLDVFDKVWAENQTGFEHSKSVVVDGGWHEIACVANGSKNDLDSDDIASLMHPSCCCELFVMAFHQKSRICGVPA